MDQAPQNHKTSDYLEMSKISILSRRSCPQNSQDREPACEVQARLKAKSITNKQSEGQLTEGCFLLACRAAAREEVVDCWGLASTRTL